MTLWLNKREKLYLMELLEADMLADVDSEDNQYLNGTSRKKLHEKMLDWFIWATEQDRIAIENGWARRYLR